MFSAQSSKRKLSLIAVCAYLSGSTLLSISCLAQSPSSVPIPSTTSGTVASTSSISAAFNNIPTQIYVGGLFQVIVTVHDQNGNPISGANIKVTMDPNFVGRGMHKVTLRDTTQTIVPEVSGVTGADGKAAIWVRLSSVSRPFKIKLHSEATVQNLTTTAESNVFQVCSADTYTEF